MSNATAERRYVMVMPVPARLAADGSFRIESAFALHLRTLKHKLGDMADRLVLMGPELDASADADKTLATIRPDEGIEFVVLYPAAIGNVEFLRRWPDVMRRMRAQIERAFIVHAGPSHLTRFFEFPSLVMARRLGKPTIFITDIDNRRSPQMQHRTGLMSLRKYLVARWVYGTAMHWQHRHAAKHFSLVLLKGADMVADYGRGQPHVHNIIDAAFEEEHLVEPAVLQDKVARAHEGPLRVVYFGRLVAYKGVDHMLRAVKVARDAGVALNFEIIGDGDERARLTALASTLGLDDTVRFVGAVPFGDALFSRLRAAHVLLAAPLSEDTPRSAFDALASGQVIVAYDTYYYRDLRKAGAPVTVVPWLDDDAMGRALVDLARDRKGLADAMLAARAHAVPNTQNAWLDQRIAWTRALVASR